MDSCLSPGYVRKVKGKHIPELELGSSNLLYKLITITPLLEIC